MISKEFYIAGYMYYIPYDFTLSDLIQHFTLHLKEIRRHHKSKFSRSLSVQLSFAFARATHIKRGTLIDLQQE